ncbi:MAG TPA: hypothetical protein VH008_16970 [Pseudonocardia sp.]|nr:hypothetical protein [Pseudonocardia sp.]
MSEAPADGPPGPDPGPDGPDPDGLTRWQAARAQRRLAGLRSEVAEAVRAAFAGARAGDRPHLRRALAAGHPAREVLALADRIATRSPDWVASRLRPIDDVPGPQVGAGVRLDQVDGTTCGTAVLLALATRADPLLALALTEPVDGFGDRFDRAQLLVHRQSNLWWPRALGTTPWGMTGWLARRATGVGPYRVRWVSHRRATRHPGVRGRSAPYDPDDVLAGVVSEVDRALALGDPVPLLVGARLPRHYVLALRPDGGAGEPRWRIYEPGSGEVRVVPVAAVRERRLASWLGFDRVHAVLLPWPAPEALPRSRRRRAGS